MEWSWLAYAAGVLTPLAVLVMAALIATMFEILR